MPSRRRVLRSLAALAGAGLASAGRWPARAQAAIPVRVGYVPVIGAGALLVLEGQAEFGDFDKPPSTEGLFDPSYYDRATRRG